MNQTNHERVSILLRRDGLSFAWCKPGEREVRTETIERPQGGFDALFTDSRWPQEEFAEVWLCVPTECAVLIPAEFDRPEMYGQFLAASGYGHDPAARVLADPIDDKVLLHGVCEEVMAPLSERFGDRLTVFHPLAVSFRQPVEEGAVLRVDCADGLGCFTLSRGGELRFADVFPIENDAALLLIVNRILAENPADTIRIVCSGERCEAYGALLGSQSHHVATHPDGEWRNLFFPLS